ncbi:TPA: hypothetical protein AB5E17_003271, partial [Vibrio cholerae]
RVKLKTIIHKNSQWFNKKYSNLRYLLYGIFKIFDSKNKRLDTRYEPNGLALQVGGKRVNPNEHR